MPAITLMPTLYFFFSNSFFLSKFFTLLFCYFFFSLFPCTLWCCYVLSFPPFVVVPCAWRRSFLYFLPWWIFTILPLNCFCLGVGVLPYHPLVCQLPSHHYLPVLVMPHLITKQRILFCLLAHYGIPIRIRVGILSHYPSWHAPSDSNSYFSLLGGMSSQQDIFPKRVWARTPK